VELVFEEHGQQRFHGQAGEKDDKPHRADGEKTRGADQVTPGGVFCVAVRVFVLCGEEGAVLPRGVVFLGNVSGVQCRWPSFLDILSKEALDEHRLPEFTVVEEPPHRAAHHHQLQEGDGTQHDFHVSIGVVHEPA
jgi:hypothetical protein